MDLMKKSFIVIFFASFIVVSFFCRSQNDNLNASGKDSVKNNESVNIKNIPTGLKKLLIAYPDFIDSVDENHLYWKDGEIMVYDDGRQKSFDERLNDPDLEDMMWQEYTPGKEYNIPLKDFDPGRIRYEPFFFKIYGSSSGEVKSYLVNIVWMPGSKGTGVSITSRDDVHIQLEAVSNELDKLPETLMNYVTKTAGPI